MSATIMSELSFAIGSTCRHSGFIQHATISQAPFALGVSHQPCPPRLPSRQSAAHLPRICPIWAEGNYRGRLAGSESSTINNGYAIHDEIAYPSWTIIWQKHHILTYSTCVQGNIWTKPNAVPTDVKLRCVHAVSTQRSIQLMHISRPNQGCTWICTPIPNLYIMGEISYSLPFLVTISLTSIWGRVLVYNIYNRIMYTSTILVPYQLIDKILECTRKYNLAGCAMVYLKAPAMIVNLYLDRQLSSVLEY
jgi:hypothetical protein